MYIYPHKEASNPLENCAAYIPITNVGLGRTPVVVVVVEATKMFKTHINKQKTSNKCIKHMHTHTHTHTHIQMYTHAHMYTLTHTCAHTRTHTCAHTKAK